MTGGISGTRLNFRDHAFPPKHLNEKGLLLLLILTDKKEAKERERKKSKKGKEGERGDEFKTSALHTPNKTSR